MAIRNSAKALIIRDEKLLVLKQQSGESIYYTLPGGGQEHGESLHDAVARECIEELGAKVTVKDLLFIRDYIGRNHEFKVRHAEAHALEMFFECTTEETDFTSGSQWDSEQIGVEWLPVSDLLSFELYPKAIRQPIINYVKGLPVHTYLGDIN